MLLPDSLIHEVDEVQTGEHEKVWDDRPQDHQRSSIGPETRDWREAIARVVARIVAMVVDRMVAMVVVDFLWFMTFFEWCKFSIFIAAINFSGAGWSCRGTGDQIRKKETYYANHLHPNFLICQPTFTRNSVFFTVTMVNRNYGVLIWN